MHNHSLPSGSPSTGRRRLTRSLAGALAIAAIAAPAASAQPWHTLGPGEGATPPDYGQPVVTRTIDGGFDTGSAAIGAGVAASLLLAAGSASASHRRHRLRVNH
jgi:hypothetical protein